MSESAMERAERFLHEEIPAPGTIADLIIETERAALERAAQQVVRFLPGNPITKLLSDLILHEVSER